MDLVLFIYLAEVSESLSKTTGIVGDISLIAAIIITVGYMCCIDDSYTPEKTTELMGRISKTTWIVGAILLVVSTLAPSQKTVYLMGAAQAVTLVSQNEKVKDIAGKSIEILEKKMDEVLNEDLIKETKKAID